MPIPVLDLTGKKFGMLTVLQYIGKRPDRTEHYWLCKCSCGEMKEISGHSMKTGRTKSCGCLRSRGYIIGPKQDLVGMHFGNLTVIECATAHGKNNGYHWKCLCDCGKTKDVKGYSLRFGKIKNCGCARRKLQGNSPFEKSRFCQYQHSAKVRGIEFSLSWDEFVGFLYANCYYCGGLPSSHYKPQRIKNFDGFLPLNGIDRIDNSCGYTLSNCVTCCGMCNKMKNIHSHDTFIKQAFNIVRNIEVQGIKRRTHKIGAV